MQRPVRPNTSTACAWIVRARCCERPAPSQSTFRRCRWTARPILADPIPILRSLHDGNERNLIVLTQPESYRKTLGRGVQFTAKWLKRKYPAMPKVLLERAKHYNETVCFCHRLAENKPQDTVLLQPEKSLNSFEKDVKKLEWGYEMGYNMTCARMEQIKNLFR